MAQPELTQPNNVPTDRPHRVSTSEKTRIQVAVYWHEEGYGTPRDAESMDEAHEMARVMLANYPAVHIIETKKTITQIGVTDVP